MPFSDFNYRILDETDHRPWPMPASPWIMTQTWNDLLFAHWRISAAVLRRLVPAPLELDTFRGEAWAGVVPFHMTNVAPRGIPSVPGLSAFPELNVRTYVRYRGRGGVFFFSLDATSAVGVRVGRLIFTLPYYRAEMRVDGSPESGWIVYRSRRVHRHAPPAELVMRYRPAGSAGTAAHVAPAPPAQGSVEAFLTERYCLFTVSPRGDVLSVDIHHPPWPLQRAEAEIDVNTMADAAGFALPPEAPLLHFAKRQDMVAWGIRREPPAA